jgi:hypothetical protein
MYKPCHVYWNNETSVKWFLYMSSWHAHIAHLMITMPKVPETYAAHNPAAS